MGFKLTIRFLLIKLKIKILLPSKRRTIRTRLFLMVNLMRIICLKLLLTKLKEAKLRASRNQLVRDQCLRFIRRMRLLIIHKYNINQKILNKTINLNLKIKIIKYKTIKKTKYKQMTTLKNQIQKIVWISLQTTLIILLLL